MAPARRSAGFILLAHWAAWVALAEGSVYVFRVRRGDTYEITDSLVGMFFYGSLCGLVTGAFTLLWRVARSVMRKP
jgi:hypothetical protein